MTENVGDFLNFNDSNEFDSDGNAVRFEGVYVKYGDISFSKHYVDKFALIPSVVGIGSDFYVINREDDKVYHSQHVSIRNFSSFKCGNRGFIPVIRVDEVVDGVLKGFWVGDSCDLKDSWYDDYCFDLDRLLDDGSEECHICEVLKEKLIKHAG